MNSETFGRLSLLALCGALAGFAWDESRSVALALLTAGAGFALLWLEGR